MTKPIGTGQLFEETAKSAFLRLTGSRYDSMRQRLERKKNGPTLPFTKEEYRAKVLAAMGGKDDGFIKCRYCSGFVSLEEVASDHEMPLSRGGSPGLDNIGLPCKRCNSRKGALTPDEFLALIRFLEVEIPLGRLDVLERLEKAVQTMAGQRFNSGVIGELKKSGAWQAARDARKAKKNGLGAF